MHQLCFLSYLTSSDWAAWIQAIGSIAAIAVAILVARHATRANLELVKTQLAAQQQEWSRARKLRYGELLGPAIALLDGLFIELDARRQETMKSFAPDEFGLPSDFLAHSSLLLKEIADISAPSMPTPRAAVTLLRARVCAQQSLKAVQQMVTDKNLLLEPSRHDASAIAILRQLKDTHAALAEELNLLLSVITDADVARVLGARTG